VAFGPEEKYDDVNPCGKDILLIVEVADRSLEQDRGEKLSIYARARIPIYWIVNLIDWQVEAYKSPRGGKNPAYREKIIYEPGDVLPIVLNGKHVADLPVEQLLP
jgi:Uma2 family endonuclease